MGAWLCVVGLNCLYFQVMGANTGNSLLVINKKSTQSKHFQMITTFLHFLALFLIHRLPESPRWLVVMNKIDEAERIIRRACHLNKSSLPSDLGLVRHAELRKWKESIQRPHFIDTFYSKAMGLRNIILFIVWIASESFISLFIC